MSSSKPKKNSQSEWGDKMALQKEVVAAVKTVAPRYDKFIDSKVRRPHLYGIRLTSAAENAVKAAGLSESHEIAPKRDSHRLQHRISCRLTKTKFELLQRAKKWYGHETTQAQLHAMIDIYLERYKMEKAAAKQHAANQNHTDNNTI